MRNWKFDKTLAGLLLLFSFLNANDSNLGSESGSVFPINHNTIQMVRENIRITITKDSIRSECIFVFFNHGKKTSVLMGFPKEMCDEGDIEAIRNFITVVNNKDISTKLSESHKKLSSENCDIAKSWYTWELTINENDSLEVCNYYSGEFGTDVCGSIFYYYTIGTGRTWYKDITKGAITFIHEEVASSLFRDIPEKNEYLSSGIKIEEYEDSVKFNFNNLEPNNDQQIGIKLIGFVHKRYKNIVLCNETKEFIRSMNYSKDKYRLMRNEIYARNGYIFSSPELNDYFLSKSWYRPKKDFAISLISLFENELVREIAINEKQSPLKKEKREKNQNEQHILQQR
jgi:hypothetical protein